MRIIALIYIFMIFVLFTLAIFTMNDTISIKFALEGFLLAIMAVVFAPIIGSYDK